MNDSVDSSPFGPSGPISPRLLLELLEGRD